MHTIGRTVFMKKVQVSLNSIDKVKSFVKDISDFSCDFDLISGRYVIDAKSMLGIFSLDLSKPIELNIHSENNADEISEAIKNQANYLLDSPDAAEELFHCNPLTPRSDGTYYFEYVFNTLAEFVKSELKVRVPKVTSRMKKYTAKYEKS